MKPRPQNTRRTHLIRALMASDHNPVETVPTTSTSMSDNMDLEDAKSHMVYNDRVDIGQPLHAN